MQETQTEVYLRLAGPSGDDPLQAAELLEFTPSGLLLEIPQETARLDVGQEVCVYYRNRHDFVKRPATIQSLLVSVPVDAPMGRIVARIEFAGEPRSAQNREVFRVAPPCGSLTICFGGCRDCPLLDISPQGLALISTADCRLGGFVSAMLEYQDRWINGRVRVQSKRPLSDGRFRYGVRCVSKELQRVLQQLAMDFQREHLRST